MHSRCPSNTKYSTAQRRHSDFKCHALQKSNPHAKPGWEKRSHIENIVRLFFPHVKKKKKSFPSFFENLQQNILYLPWQQAKTPHQGKKNFKHRSKHYWQKKVGRGRGIQRASVVTEFKLLIGDCWLAHLLRFFFHFGGGETALCIFWSKLEDNKIHSSYSICVKIGRSDTVF